MTSPLEGIIVLDFTRIVAGPFATQILGDLGADVIKVERADGGEEARAYGVTDPSRMPGATFLAMNRNKRSIGIDLQTDAGRDVARRLLATSDVAIHNFRTGVMDRLGLGYEPASIANPRLIYCSITGFGSVGPQRDSAANDLAIQAYSGLLSITGEADGPPVRNPTAVSDITSGLYAAIGILSALHHREQTGRGQAVETNMLEGQLNMLNLFFVDYWLNGLVPQRMGTGNRMGLPNQAFPAKDGWVCIVAPTDRIWVKCCEALGVAPLAKDPRFASLAERYGHRDELVAAVSDATSRLSIADCVTRLTSAGVPCAPVNTIPEVAIDRQVQALESIVEMPVAGLGPVKLVRSPLHFSHTPVTERIPPPSLGEHTDEILSRIGFSASEIAHLRSERSVA